ncbi:MAG TPA: ABC transporter substrate-binding protein, partial [Devosia sp.]|nr:ABC transporter substrate-binding protein [Devosia sp.]
AAIKAAATDAGKGLVVLTSGAEVTAYGTGSRFGWIHDSLGIIPAVADVEAATHGDAVSFEFLLETNPDWLFVIDRDAATGEGSAAAILDNELVAETNAWKNGHVVYIDPVRSYIVNGGLPAFTALVDQVGDALGVE